MKKLTILSLALLLIACKKGNENTDASGTFEATEIIISSEASGIIMQFDINEGQTLDKNRYIGYIDSLQLYLKKQQLEAQVRSILVQAPDVNVQVAGLKEQLKTAEKEQQRMKKLFEANAATAKQVDDVNAQVAVFKKQIAAMESSLSINVSGLNEQTRPLLIQIAQLEDQLSRCRLFNPVAGTVLTKFAEAKEMTTAGKPLYKIADLSELVLKAYITSGQLSQVKLGQDLKVLVDNGDEASKEYIGKLEWVSDKAEFTPKTIQTKDERANLVYAIKIRVKNDGYLKLGMYADVKF